MAAVAWEGKLWVLGGSSRSDNMIWTAGMHGMVEVLAPAIKSNGEIRGCWEAVASLPESVSHLGAVAIDDALWAIGGYSDQDASANAVHILTG